MALLNAVLVKPGLIHGTDILQLLHHVLLAWLDQQRLYVVRIGVCYVILERLPIGPLEPPGIYR